MLAHHRHIARVEHRSADPNLSESHCEGAGLNPGFTFAKSFCKCDNTQQRCDGAQAEAKFTTHLWRRDVCRDLKAASPLHSLCADTVLRNTLSGYWGREGGEGGLDRKQIRCVRSLRCSKMNERVTRDPGLNIHEESLLVGCPTPPDVRRTLGSRLLPPAHLQNHVISRMLDSSPPFLGGSGGNRLPVFLFSSQSSQQLFLI